MKRSVKFSVSVCASALLSTTAVVAQSRFSGEIGRGFPYSSGGKWSWEPFVFIFVLIIFFSIAGAAKDTLEDQPWWHTLIVILATLLSSVALAVKVSQPYPAEFMLVVFMLIPSFACIALLYLAVIKLVQIKQNKGSK